MMNPVKIPRLGFKQHFKISQILLVYVCGVEAD